MVCINCSHLRTKQNPSPANFLLFGCGLKKKQIGLESDAKKEKACKDMVKRL